MKIKTLSINTCHIAKQLLFSNASTFGLKKFLLVFLFFYSSIGYTQKVQSLDSLENKSFDYLYDKFWAYGILAKNKDFEKANIYIKSILRKAKKIKDTVKIISGHYFLSKINYQSFEASIKHIDTAIVLCKMSKNRGWLIQSLNQKGALYYDEKRQYKKALDLYLEARDLVDKVDDPYTFYNIEYHIGLIKMATKDFQAGKEKYSAYYRYITKNNLQLKEIYQQNYAITVSSLSLAFWHTQELDSAIYYNNLALKAPGNQSDKNIAGLRVDEAFFNYDRKNYTKTLDSIAKYLPTMEEKAKKIDVAMAYLYRGKAHWQLNNRNEAIKSFKKVDTIIQQSGQYSRGLKEGYQLLRSYYKNKNDQKNELLYLDKLLKFDSIIHDNHDYLKTTLFDKYEIPQLLKERDELIDELKTSGTNQLNLIFGLSGLAAVLMGIAFYYYRKKIIYKQRFKRIVETNKLEKETNTVPKKTHSLTQDLVEGILEKLKTFEAQEDFLDNKLTLNSVAKSLGTNSNYLSKIINSHKHKNFSAYITELRIKYVVEALKENPKLREYTIKAIAFEVGFKNPQSFTTAFYEYTKLYPSYFIKQLQKQRSA